MAEQKRSSVTEIKFKKEGTGQNGAWYLFEIAFANGDKGDYFAKSNPQNVFKQGEEIDYIKEVKQNDKYTNVSIKPVQQNKGGNGGKFDSKGANKRAALDAAAKFVSNRPQLSSGDCLDLADKFTEWLNK